MTDVLAYLTFGESLFVALVLAVYAAVIWMIVDILRRPDFSATGEGALVHRGARVQRRDPDRLLRLGQEAGLLAFSRAQPLPRRRLHPRTMNDPTRLRTAHPSAPYLQLLFALEPTAPGQDRPAAPPRSRVQHPPTGPRRADDREAVVPGLARARGRGGKVVGVSGAEGPPSLARSHRRGACRGRAGARTRTSSIHFASDVRSIPKERQ